VVSPETCGRTQQLRPRAGMALMAATLAATAVAPLWRLVARRASARRWSGPSLEGGQLMPPQLLVLLLQNLELSDELSDTLRSRQPVGC
jgi:hypothetical protein